MKVEGARLLHEKLHSWLSHRRKLAAATLAALAFSSCTAAATPNSPANKAHTKHSPDQTLPATDKAAEQLWSQALNELRMKVAGHQTVKLMVSKGNCVYWPSSITGIDTVVRNPAMYHYKTGTAELDFLPFVPSAARDLTIMNGPFQYSDQSKHVEGIGNMSGVLFYGDALVFGSFVGALTLHEETHPTPFTEAWLQADDGRKISETKLVEDSNIASAFPDCHLHPIIKSA